MRYVPAAENEVYRAVLNGTLEIDPMGRIWRVGIQRQGVVRACPRRRAETWLPTGYLQVRAMFGGQRFHALAHRLVYRHVFGPIPDGLTINHRDGAKWNNRPENLETANDSEQAIHALQVLRRGRVDQNGTKNAMARLTTAQVQVIRQRRATGEKLASIAVDFGVRYQHISRIARGDRRSVG